MSRLELKVPPLLLLFIFMALAYFTPVVLPYELTGNFKYIMVGVISTLGLGVILAGVIAFKRHQTTVNPVSPQDSSSLVTSSIYRFTRNPMYLGFALLLLAWTIWLQDLFLLVLVGVFIQYLTHLQIIPEERMLNQLFGQQFQAYCQKVRRWI